MALWQCKTVFALIFGLGTVLGTPPQVDKLVVLDPFPVVNIPGREVLRVACSASGDPLPTYSWRKDGKDLKDKDENNRIKVTEGQLEISNLDYVKDSGHYLCLATNTFGTVFKELKIDILVLGKFFPPNTASADRREVGVVIGKYAIVECPPHSPARPEIYFWGSLPDNQKPFFIERTRRRFVTPQGHLVFAHVTPGDIDEINERYGVSCLIYNNGKYESSRKYTLRNDGTENVPRRPTLEAYVGKAEVALKDQEKLLVCGARGQPTPEITWYKDGVKIVQLNDKRLNFDGYQFTAEGVELTILRPRELDTANFRCYATNSVGEDFKEGGLSVQFKPEWVKQIEAVTVPFSNSHMFNCSAIGEPKVVYEWYKNGTLLTTNDNIIIDENILTIKSAVLTDSGMYTCLVRNTHGSITSQAQVIAAAVAPKFIAPYPDPYYLYRGRTSTISCSPGGGPKPDKRWFKDGVLISSSGRFQILESGALQISSVEDGDKGVYKCIATNIAGTDEAEARVEVVDATTITVGPANRTVKEGFVYHVLCDATYDRNLELRIDWYKEGALIKTFDDRVFLERRVTEPSHIITIQNVTFQDRGNWTCHAYTQLTGMVSEDWASGVLEVSAPPDPPNDLHLANDCSDLQTILVWQLGNENEDYIRHFIIEYSSDYEDDADSWYIYENRAEPGNRISLEMTELSPYARLRFRVRAVNSVGISDPSLSTLPSACVTPAAPPTTNPANVRGEGGEPNKLIIAWDPVKRIQQNGPDFKYEVGYRRISDTTGKWEIVNVTNVTTRFEVPSPGFFQEYEVYVRNYNQKGPGPEPTKYRVYSGQDRPTVGPSNVRVARGGANNIEVAWDPVNIKEPGNIAGYVIYYWNVTKPYRIVIERRDRRALPDPNALNRTYYVGPSGPFQAEIANLTAALRYNLVMTAFNSGGEGPWSSTLVFETMETAPDMPHDVSMTVYGNVLHIQWQAPLEPNGRVISYFIETDPPTRQVVLDGLEREHYLTGLEPVHYYLVRIAARNAFGPGVYYERRIAVSQPDKPGKPKTPRVKPYDSDSVNVTYQVPGYGGLPTKFRACYKPKEALYFDLESRATCVEREFPRRAWVVINGLNEIKHEFWTVGVNNQGEGEASERVVSIPLPFPRFGVRTKETPWWKSSWLVGIVACIIFLLIVLSSIIYLMKKAHGKYPVGSRENARAGWNRQKVREYGRDPYADYATEPLTRNDPVDSRPPPKYSSQSSLEKKPPSDDNDSLADYGEDTKFAEDGSFIGQYGDEKHKESQEPDVSTFV